jgi:hypothetical protein
MGNRNQEETKITKLTNETFLVQYAGDHAVMSWAGLLDFYVNTLEAESETIEQIMTNISFNKIGETFFA